MYVAGRGSVSARGKSTVSPPSPGCATSCGGWSGAVMTKTRVLVALVQAAHAAFAADDQLALVWPLMSNR